MFLHPNSRLRTTRAATTTHSIIALLRMVTLILGIYWIALFVATHLPAAHVPNMGSDKVQHLIAFAGLGVLLNWAIGLRINRISTQVGIAWLIAVAYAAIDEWSQQFVVGRTPDVADALADACGAALGIVMFQLLRTQRYRLPRWFPVIR